MSYESKLKREESIRRARNAKRSLFIQNTLIVLIVVGVFIFFGYKTFDGTRENHPVSYYFDTTSVSGFQSAVSDAINGTDAQVIEETLDESAAESDTDVFTDDEISDNVVSDDIVGEDGTEDTAE